MQNRFTDENKTARDFYAEVWVVCPGCSKKAIAKTIIEKKVARLQCQNCGYNKEVFIESKLKIIGDTAECLDSANSFFGAELWLKYPFKSDFFIAYNGEELKYLEQYISANLREHKDRIGFTLLEKLPKFYHEAKNRKALLAIIQKLKNKK